VPRLAQTTARAPLLFIIRMKGKTNKTYNMVCFSTFFTSMKKHISKAIAKKYILNHSILYIYCVYVLIWSSTELDFSFYDFSMIYNVFKKLL
jgi:hypothetical protein